MDWSEREREIRERLEAGAHPAQHFGWALAALREALAEIERLRAKPKVRKG